MGITRISLSYLMIYPMIYLGQNSGRSGVGWGSSADYFSFLFVLLFTPCNFKLGVYGDCKDIFKLFDDISHDIFGPEFWEKWSGVGWGSSAIFQYQFLQLMVIYLHLLTHSFRIKYLLFWLHLK